MFTGIIEELGKITCIKNESVSAKISISAHKVLEDVAIGDSIAVNGICLTVTSFTKDCFQADVMPQTMRKSSLSAVTKNSFVNLERAMSVSKRFGGHIVSGHIDGTGIITNIKTEENAVWFSIKATSDLMKTIIERGSITIDGISLTVAKVDYSQNVFEVSTIPHTREVTNLKYKKRGDLVNLETDIIGKYVYHLMNIPNDTINAMDNVKPVNNKGLSLDFLASNGFL
ncbi:riboflavin synthase [Butyrivibrio sp. NC3005]|uniref:riboflavin synthase n=1 Tax=Butyrivibrio sp. NC3005 TaxID=1280685 RepID=UPI00040D873C|nr:riboflavin synthase [Butyrivibrio sp. NC3005]